MTSNTLLSISDRLRPAAAAYDRKMTGWKRAVAAAEVEATTERGTVVADERATARRAGRAERSMLVRAERGGCVYVE